MEDKSIIALYFDRDDTALNETDNKYGKLIFGIAYKILGNTLDSAECKNDTLFALWNSIPPTRPKNLSAFVSVLARRKAIDRLRQGKSRGSEEYALSLDELSELIPSTCGAPEIEISEKELAALISSLLKKMPKAEANVFIRRYWYFESIKEIAERYGFTESKVKMLLVRTREKLGKLLKKEELI